MLESMKPRPQLLASCSPHLHVGLAPWRPPRAPRRSPPSRSLPNKNIYRNRISSQHQLLEFISFCKKPHISKQSYIGTEKNGFVTATKLGITEKFFVAATKNFAAATKRFVDRTKHFVVVTKYFCYPYFNK